MVKQFDKVLALPGAHEEKSDRQFVTALARGLEVLRAFQPEDGPLGNQELAERTGLPKPTVSRITHTLTTLGYLDYVPRLARYTIAPSVLSLGHACVGAAGVRRVALPHMQALAEYADATVALGARDRLSMIYLDVARSRRTVAFSLDAGARVPIQRTAMGAAFLWALPAKERDFLMDAIRLAGAEAWNEIRARLEKGFSELADTGFCVFEGAYERTMNGVGSAFVQADGMVYAFSCSAPAFQSPTQQLRGDVGPRLVAMTRAIAAEMA